MHIVLEQKKLNKDANWVTQQVTLQNVYRRLFRVNHGSQMLNCQKKPLCFHPVLPRFTIKNWIDSDFVSVFVREEEHHSHKHSHIVCIRYVFATLMQRMNCFLNGGKCDPCLTKVNGNNGTHYHNTNLLLQLINRIISVSLKIYYFISLAHTFL